MKHLFSVVVALALAIPALAQAVKTNSMAGTNAPASDAQSSGQTLLGSAAVLTAPMILTNACLCLTNDGIADPASGGKAVFTFSITNAGNYIIEGLANGPDDNSNSFFVNVDAAPGDDMVWDIEVADGFDKHVASWRGSGDATTPEFAPKIFKLEPGEHKVILTGREPGTLLKSLTLRPAPAQAAAP